jgi:hypothetical protein
MSSLQTQLDAEVILENMPFNITNGLRMIKVFIALCGKKPCRRKRLSETFHKPRRERKMHQHILSTDIGKSTG